MKKNLEYLFLKKKNSSRFSMITAYDFPMAQIAEAAGVDAVLVGDSVGTNVLGYASEQEVTMADMLHHTAAVARGINQALLVADLPFHAAETPHDAETNASLLLEKGACVVKLEGWGEKHTVISHLSRKDIPVCAHIGYNPQIHGSKPKVFGGTVEEARSLIESAVILEESGAALLVIEKVPEEVAGIITSKLTIPTIGIGSGRFCDGQVLVINDLLGVTTRTFKHARRYMDFYALALRSIQTYAMEVGKGLFPSDENVTHIDAAKLELL